MRSLTAPGLAGVAVVAFDRGERDAVAACLRGRSGLPFAFVDTPVPRLASLAIEGRILDEVLVVDRGERGLELHLHGSPQVLAALAAVWPLREPARRRHPADRLLRSALSVEQLDLALEQRAADFDGLLAETAGQSGAPRARALAAARERSRIALAHQQPCRLVFAGAQNAGKSTLFNRLLFRERALTGALPGLTRDPVREATALVGYPYELTDTAGEGAAGSSVDELAIAAGRRLRAGAILVLVVDGSRGPTASDRRLAAAASLPTSSGSSCGRILVLANKRDLPAAAWPPDFRCDLRVSATLDEPARLRVVIGQQLARLRGLPPAGPVGGAAALDRTGLAALEALAEH